MKKLILPLSLMIISATMAEAQPAKRTSAYNYLGYGELDNAKEAIDAASVHEKTISDPKTWLYRGQIYQGIYESQDPKFKSLSDNALDEAYAAFTKCNELDEKGTHSDVTVKYLDIQSRQFVNEGITAYNNKNYGAALKAFENVIAITELPKLKRIDSLSIYYSGACAELSGDLAKAEKHYRRAIAINYQAEQAFVRMSRMFAGAGEKDKAFEIVKEGRKMFPDNQTLVTEEVNAYLMADRHAEAMEALKVAIGLDPDNFSLHFALGFVNDRLAAKSLEANSGGGAEYENYLAEAEKSYKRSIELNGENFDAVYNLGALYFNRAVKLNEVANSIDDMKKFQVAKKAADVVFDQSLPILEKAYSLNGMDKGVLISLKQLYYRKMTNDDSYEAKYNEVVEKLKTAE